MQQTNRVAPDSPVTPSPVPATGPAAEATTPAILGLDQASEPDSFALVTVMITHNKVVISGVLNMGGQHTRNATWERRRGGKTGWICNGARDFVEFESQISLELAEYLDGLSFPFAVANMLPGKRASAAAVAAAAAEVRNA